VHDRYSEKTSREGHLQWRKTRDGMVILCSCRGRMDEISGRDGKFTSFRLMLDETRVPDGQLSWQEKSGQKMSGEGLGRGKSALFKMRRTKGQKLISVKRTF